VNSNSGSQARTPGAGAEISSQAQTPGEAESNKELA
jgi:hypothetical protein